MHTYFVRHGGKLSMDTLTMERLWSDRKIAIHYPYDSLGTRPKGQDNISLDPGDYRQNDSQAVASLIELARYGGYVCAEYRNHTDCLVGLVMPATNIEIIQGMYGDKDPRLALFKTLQLSSVQVVPIAQYGMTLIGRPRQGAIKRWHACGRRIEYLVEGKLQTGGVESLLPHQQEILCSEMLRLPIVVSYGLPRMAHLFSHVGRTMRDIDICGMTSEGELIYAQVTFYSANQVETRLKHQRLMSYKQSQRHNLVLFCNCEAVEIKDGILYFPLALAFRIFMDMETGKEWMRVVADI